MQTFNIFINIWVFFLFFLQEFLQKEFSEENIQFWRKCNNFKNSTLDEQQVFLYNLNCCGVIIQKIGLQILQIYLA